jgi:16S rRNA (guanine966-N2)-methyltransferase
LRIIAGAHRGRRLRAPAGGARPTADRAREAVFNILAHGVAGAGIDGVSVLDVFAGSGALGLEALSRGAVHATFMDDDGAALACVRANLKALDAAADATLLDADATRPPPPPLAARAPCALVFLDPPYGSGLAPEALAALAAKGWIAGGAVCVAEVAAREDFAVPARFDILEERTYGATRVVFLRRARESAIISN